MLAVRTLAHSAPWIGARELDAAAWALSNGHVAHGSQARAFERELSTALDAPYVRVAGSGTEALVLALLAVGVESGDEVVCPTYVCASVTHAIRRCGAVPVLADNGRTWHITAESVQAVRTIRTRAVVAVHIFGMRCDVESIAALGLPVVEDACQAFGLARKGSPAACAVYSFHATKCLTAGEGGAIATSSSALAGRIENLSARAAASMRFSDLQASVARVQLSRYDEMRARRADIAAAYLDALPPALTAPWREAASNGAVWFRAPLWMPRAVQHLAVRLLFDGDGVAVRQGVDALLHREHGRDDAQFPMATRAFDHTLSIPLWPAMLDDDVARVIDAVRLYVGA